VAAHWNDNAAITTIGATLHQNREKQASPDLNLPTVRSGFHAASLIIQPTLPSMMTILPTELWTSD
jgi:hypothetical protein